YLFFFISISKSWKSIQERNQRQTGMDVSSSGKTFAMMKVHCLLSQNLRHDEICFFVQLLNSLEGVCLWMGPNSRIWLWEPIGGFFF
ncbi:hypothetical protein PJP10_31945, partial [Mycobacterium kansasii]